MGAKWFPLFDYVPDMMKKVGLPLHWACLLSVKQPWHPGLVSLYCAPWHTAEFVQSHGNRENRGRALHVCHAPRISFRHGCSYSGDQAPPQYPTVDVHVPEGALFRSDRMDVFLI